MHTLKTLISHLEEKPITTWDQLRWVIIVAVVANLAMWQFDSDLYANGQPSQAVSGTAE